MKDKRDRKGLSDKEAALIAAARQELGKAPAPIAARPPSGTAPARAADSLQRAAPKSQPHPQAIESSTKPAQPAAVQEPIVPAPMPDATARMAMLLESERIAAVERKKRIRRNYMIVLAAIIVMASIYVVVNLFRILTG